MKYAGQIRSNGSLDYCSPIVETREEAAAICFRKRPMAQTCITMEAHWNETLNETVPTHHRVQQHKRPQA